MSDITVPASSLEIARKIVRSWAKPKSNYVLVAPPLTDASFVIDRLLDERFYAECGIDPETLAVARFRAGRVEGPESFIKSIVVQWDPTGTIQYKGQDIGNDLRRAVKHLKELGRIPVLVIEAFHQAVRTLTWDVGTALRELEHSLQLKTVVELPIKLSTLSNRWAVRPNERAFLASAFGQAHNTLVLGTFSDEEVTALLDAYGIKGWRADAVRDLSGGIPDLTGWLAREAEYCDSREALQACAERGAQDICHRFLKWLDAPGEMSFTRTLAKMHEGSSMAGVFATARQHEWADFMLRGNDRLRAKILGLASMQKLSHLNDAPPHEITLEPSSQDEGSCRSKPSTLNVTSRGVAEARNEPKFGANVPAFETIVVVGTCWGVTHGGINSFNLEFCRALAADKTRARRVICIVPNASDILEALGGVEVVSIRDDGPSEFLEFDTDLAIARLRSIAGARYVVGHDLKTGSFANSLSSRLGAKSVVFCHMAYAAYYSMMKSSEDSLRKIEEQRKVFSTADVVFAVGPKLIKQLRVLLRIIPSRVATFEYLPDLLSVLPATEPREIACITYVGRLGSGAELVKQGVLAVTAIGTALRETRVEDPLVRIIGGTDPGDEAVYKKLVAKEAERLVNTEFLGFSSSRSTTLEYIMDSSLIVMPSVHDGFGLVGWEAISLGIPLIISRNTGLYELLRDRGLHGLVGSVDIKGSLAEPEQSDVSALANEIVLKLADPIRAHADAATLLRRLKVDGAAVTAMDRFNIDTDSVFGNVNGQVIANAG
jgi:glycosyltransferase involved in cell wall biosynthesis